MALFRAGAPLALLWSLINFELPRRENLSCLEARHIHYASTAENSISKQLPSSRSEEKAKHCTVSYVANISIIIMIITLTVDLLAFGA